MSVLRPHLEIAALPEPHGSHWFWYCNPCQLKTPKERAIAVVYLRLLDKKLCRECALDLQNDLIHAAEQLMEFTR